MDIGESIVGSYMRAVRGCHSVTYNTYLPTGQGEIDVIGVRLGETVEIFAAEVAIHLQGLEYGSGYVGSTEKVVQKMRLARTFCEQVYGSNEINLEFWAPIAPSGLVTSIGEHESEVGFTLVANGDFTDRVKQLITNAGTNTKTTGEPAYRMLQILTHVRNHTELRF